jgi:hypothetical protein
VGGHEKIYGTDAIFLQTEKIYHHPGVSGIPGIGLKSSGIREIRKKQIRELAKKSF